MLALWSMNRNRLTSATRNKSSWAIIILLSAFNWVKRREKLGNLNCHTGIRRRTNSRDWKRVGLVHISIEVYAIRYSLYAIRFALRHKQDSATSTLHHLNVACGHVEESKSYSEKRITYIAYFYVNEAVETRWGKTKLLKRRNIKFVF